MFFFFNRQFHDDSRRAQFVSRYLWVELTGRSGDAMIDTKLPMPHVDKLAPLGWNHLTDTKHVGSSTFALFSRWLNCSNILYHILILFLFCHNLEKWRSRLFHLQFWLGWNQYPPVTDIAVGNSRKQMQVYRWENNRAKWAICIHLQ